MMRIRKASSREVTATYSGGKYYLAHAGIRTAVAMETPPYGDAEIMNALEALIVRATDFLPASDPAEAGRP